MIHICEDIWAKPTSMGFDLVQLRPEKDKNGNDKYTVLGYCGNIEEVCWLAYKHISGARCAKEKIELKEAIQIMKDTREMIRKALGEFE